MRTLPILPLLVAASVSAAAADTPATRLFQVIMIEAATTEELPTAGIPPSAMKALDDMRDFLPYKGYRLLDTALVRTAGDASTTLKGPKGAPYQVDMSVARSEREEEPDIFFRRFMVRQVPGGPPHPGVVEMGGSKNSPGMKMDHPAPAAPRTLIETSFGMDVGETIIVGSSRLNGDSRALVMLVTALP